MTPLCSRCSYLVSHGLPAGGCPSCKRALVRDVAFNPAYRGLTVDRVAALLIALAAVVVAVVADPNRVVVCASAALLVAGPYSLFARPRFTPRGRRRAGRASPGVAAAAAAPSIAAQRRPHLNARI